MRKSTGQIYKKEAPKSSAGPQHSNTRSRNYKQIDFRGDPATRSKVFLNGSSVLFCLKAFKITFKKTTTVPFNSYRNSRKKEGRKETLILLTASPSPFKVLPERTSVCIPPQHLCQNCNQRTGGGEKNWGGVDFCHPS